MEQPTFRAPLMRRVQEEQVQRRRAWFGAGPKLRLAALAAVLLLVAIAAYNNWVHLPRHSPTPKFDGTLPPMLVATQAPDAAQSATEATTPRTAILASDLPLELNATVLGPPAIATITVTKDGEAMQGEYEVGDTVLPDITVAAIRDGEIDLDCGGQTVALAQTSTPEHVAPPDVDGVWKVASADGSATVEAPTRVTLTRANASLTVTWENEVVARATLSGRRIMGAIYSEHAGSKLTVPVEGEFSEDWRQLDVRVTHPISTIDPDFPKAVRLVRLTGDQLAADISGVLARHECEQRVKSMAEVLSLYAEANSGTFPAVLKDLTPEYAKDPSLFANTDSQEVKYIPGGIRYSKVLDFPPPAVLADAADLTPELLMAHEMELRELGYANILWPKEILEVTFRKVPVAFTVNTECAVNEKMDKAPDLSDPVVASATRAQCQNNLKQLGPVMKIFEVQKKGWLPPGWLTAYTENVFDPAILTSPKDRPGTDSYTVLLPAAHVPALMAQIVDDYDPTAVVIGGGPMGDIPFAINRTDFTHPKAGRNVLFLDGHVEYVTRGGVRWNTVIEPALAGLR